MKSLPRVLAAVTTALLATGLVALGATSAQAIPSGPADIHVLVFANSNVNDTSPGQEVDQELAIVNSWGVQVSTFDGGDGSDTAWTAALAGQDVLVLPEQEESDAFFTPGGTAYLSAAALLVLKGWATAGGYIVANGSFGSDPQYSDLIGALTGKDYTSVWTITDDNSMSWNLSAASAGLPDPLGYADGSYGIGSYGTWSDDLKSIVHPLYVTADAQNMVAGSFEVGSGRIAYIGRDFYPDEEASEALNADWAHVLSVVATDQVLPLAAAPVLANTGVPVEPILAAGVLLLLVGGAVVLVRRRRLAA